MKYEKPADLKISMLRGRILLSTPQGGNVAVDTNVFQLLEYANGRDLETISHHFEHEGKSSTMVRACLACLAEAGLLSRSGEVYKPTDYPKVSGCLVSIVIVNHNSLNWLQECLSSIIAQTYEPLEVILVDNGSAESPANWVSKNFPKVDFIQLDRIQSLAAAINRGVVSAHGDYFLILNPDVRLEPNAVAELVAVANRYTSCAVVATKLKFWWAPAFLNGLGNHVPAFRWGMDIGLGHLDLGQFDAWEQVPSACFAAALIRKSAYEAVGALDEGFHLYYEDVEWCYRARLLGYVALVAPRAVIYHALGRRIHTGEEVDLSAIKLKNVVFGRLRFTGKLASPWTAFYYLLSYFLADIGLAFLSGLKLDLFRLSAISAGWIRFIREVGSLRIARRAVQLERKTSDANIFRNRFPIPAPLIWNGLPELTWGKIEKHYLPLIKAGKTIKLVEFDE